MTYRILVDPYARKQLGALDKPHRRRILARIEALAENPRPPGALMLVGRHGDFRIRVGDYRVLYTVRDAELIVLVIEVGQPHPSHADRSSVSSVRLASGPPAYPLIEPSERTTR